MKCIITFFITLIILATAAKPVVAIVDPLSVNNNKYGIHIVDPGDLSDARDLLNSGGGDWGYVTLVIQSNDRNHGKWQEVFDRMRAYHLIPIVRLATSISGSTWTKPDKNDIGSWVDFLNDLNWVVKNRYVIIFNEPNHALEWGGSLNPGEYAQILQSLSIKLKDKSPDFFILPAGLDASAPNSFDTMDEKLFLRQMKAQVPDIFDRIDGWNSHSYPNPGFTGSPFATGRGTVKGYEWELDTLSSLGVNQNLPIFITETGWPHREGVTYNDKFVSDTTSATYIKTTLTSVWTSPRIVAITPFLLSYQSFPFDNFSWKKPDGRSYYEEFTTVQDIPKSAGNPERIINTTLIDHSLPEKLITDSDYIVEQKINNQGQTIFQRKDGFDMSIEFTNPRTNTPADFSPIIVWDEPHEPKSIAGIPIRIHTPLTYGLYSYNIRIMYQNQQISQIKGYITLIEPPTLAFRVTTGLNSSVAGHDYTLLIYDDTETPILKFNNISVVDGAAELVKLKSIVVGKPYRIVIQKPYYLPRQEKLIFKERENMIKFKPLLPLDMDLDGKFSLNDYWIMIFHPIFVLSLLF